MNKKNKKIIHAKKKTSPHTKISNSNSSKHKQSKESLEELRQLYETILDHTHILVALFDPQFNFIKVNRAYAEADEREPSFYPGKNHFDLFPSKENERIFQRVVETGESYFAYAKPFEYAEHPERGTSYWDWSLIPTKDANGTVMRLVLSLANVTARIKSEEEIRKLSRAVEQSPVTVVITDPEGKIEYVNPKFVKLTGYTSKEVIGKNPNILKSGIHTPEFYKDLWDTIKQGKSWHGEFHNKKKNGDLYVESALISPIKDEKGNIVHFIGIKEDITEHKKLEESLKESEKKYRAIFENTGTATMIIEEDMTISMINTEFENLTGYSKEEVEGKKSWAEFVMPEDLKNMKQHHDSRRINPEDAPRHHELQFIDRHKKIKEVFATVDMIPDTKQSIVSALDITDFKAAEAALKESEEKFRMLAENSDDVIYHLDENLNRIYISPSIERFLGYTPDEHIKQSREEFYTPEAIKQFQSAVKEIFERIKSGMDKERPIRLEFEVKHKNGSTLWVETRAKPLYDDKDNFKGIIGISRDITERRRIEQESDRYKDQLEKLVDARTQELKQKISEQKQTEKRLRESEVRYRTVADFTYDWEYWENPDRTLLYVSPSCERITGYKPEEFIKKPRLMQDIILSEDKDIWHSHRQKINKEKKRYSIQFRIRKKNGEVAWIEHACRTVTDEEGNSLGYRVNNRDVTERKLTQEEADRLREELAHLTRSATLGELTASLAHELGQPLTAILSNAQAAQRFLAGDTPDVEEIREIVKDIISDDQRASEVVHRLRAMMKKEPKKLKPLQINEVIREVENLIKSDALIRNIAMELDLDAYLPEVLGDRIQLQQVILNLIMNGFEAMMEKKPEKRRLVIRTKLHDKDSIEVAVNDSGQGIDKIKENELFEPFYSTKSEGLGMGLAIVRSTIETHGGRVWASNNRGLGATFHFTLPKEKGDAER